MVKLCSLLLVFLLWHSPTDVAHTFSGVVQAQPPKIETNYDRSKDKTTVRLAPVQISGAKDKYHSLHMAPSFSYPGREARAPEVIDFELQTVVKGKLRVDLYVLFIVNDEKIFLSSSRWGLKKGNLGRGWMGEHLVFRMPYETFQKIIKADSFEISLDGINFPVDDDQRNALRELEKLAKVGDQKSASTCIEAPPGETTHWSNGELIMKDDKIYQRLHGVVSFPNGSPAPGALLEIYDKPENVLRLWKHAKPKSIRQRRIATCKTGPDGRFNFANIAPGKYELRGSKSSTTCCEWNPVRAYVVLDPRKRNSTYAELEIHLPLSH